MLCGCDPVAHDLFEFIRRHAGVRDSDDLEDGGLATGECALQVAFQERSEGLHRCPFGVLRGQQLHAVESEDKLKIDRLLSPQGAVIVKGGDTLGGWHEVGRALLRHAFDESHDGFLGCRVVP